MLRLRTKLVKAALVLVVLLLPFLAFSTAAFIRFDSTIFTTSNSGINGGAYVALLLIATVTWVLMARIYGLTSTEKLFAVGGKSSRIASACGGTFLVTLAASNIYREAEFSRIFLLLTCLLLFFFAVASQIMFRVLMETLRRRGKYCIRALVISADQFAVEMALKLARGQQITPCHIVGYVTLPGHPVAVKDSRVHELSEIPTLALANDIDEAILALPYSLFEEIPAILRKLEPLCVPTRAVLAFGDDVQVQQQLFDFGGMPMLDLRPTPTESVAYALIKRPFDLLFSTLVLILSSPIFILAAITIKLTSRGPVFFVQDRVGLRGQVFRMYKFRSMRIDREQEMNTRWTVRNDPRCTPIGSFLRRTSLDELPQFFNVIKGDMSIVGPRPERPYFVNKFVKEFDKYNNRHALRAGITGWAQVNGYRGDTSITERVQYDLYYMQNWSLGFDLQIILLTLLRGFINRNAY